MKITLGAVFDAMEKNGYEKIQTGGYIIFSEGDENDYYGDWDFSKVIGACAYGQAALNLKVMPTQLHQALSTLGPDIGVRFDKIIFDNDSTDMTVPEIARKYRETAKDHLDHVIYV